MYGHLVKYILISTLSIAMVTLGSSYKEIYAKKEEDSAGKQATQTEVNEGISKATKTIRELTKKIYAGALFSPKDSDKLIGLKMNLYSLWEKNPTNRELAEPMYNTAILLKQRELYDEAIEVLNIVAESFPPAEDEDEEEGVLIDYSSKAQELIKKIKQEAQN